MEDLVSSFLFFLIVQLVLGWVSRLVHGTLWFIIDSLAPPYIIESHDPLYSMALRLFKDQAGRHLPRRLVLPTDCDKASYEVQPHQTVTRLLFPSSKWKPILIEMTRDNPHSPSVLVVRAPGYTPTQLHTLLKQYDNDDQVQETVMTELGYSKDGRLGQWIRPCPLVLPPSISSALDTTIRNFLDPNNPVMQCGILLHGPPGTGKSSTARNVAHRNKMTLCKVPYRSITALSSALQRVRERLVVLIDDIDLLVQDDELVHCLLDILDTPRTFKTLFIMTTNHLEKIPPAIRRRGRIDLHLHYEELDAETTAMLATQLIDDVELRATALRMLEEVFGNVALPGSNLTAYFHATCATDMLAMMQYDKERM